MTKGTLVATSYSSNPPIPQKPEVIGSFWLLMTKRGGLKLTYRSGETFSAHLPI